MDIDTDLRDILYENDTLDVVLTNCNTGKQTRESWSFVFDKNKCTSLNRHDILYYKRIHTELDTYNFSNSKIEEEIILNTDNVMISGKIIRNGEIYQYIRG